MMRMQDKNMQLTQQCRHNCLERKIASSTDAVDSLGSPTQEELLQKGGSLEDTDTLALED